MPENIFQQQDGITTSITGLTCKPLTILSETISPEEMSMARGEMIMVTQGGLRMGQDAILIA